MRLPKLFRTSAFRLTLSYVALFGIAVLILFGVLWTVMTDYARDQLKADVNAEIAALRTDENEPEEMIERIRAHAVREANKGMYWLLQAKDGRPLAGNIPPQPVQYGWFEITVPRADKPRKQRVIRANGVALAGDTYLVVGFDPKAQKQVRELSERIADSFTITAIATLLLALAGGTLVGTQLLRRVERIGRTSREIAEGDLGRRLPVRGNEDELDHLATDLNRMLERMQIQFETVRQVSSDIAHDLRTPLTRLRQRLERARDAVMPPDELRGAIERAIDDTDAILATFAALLRIAEIESDPHAGRFASVDLSETLRTLVEVYQPLADEGGKVLDATIPDALTLAGDRAMLAQMFANLLENALRHTPTGSTIRLAATDESDAIEIVIEDNGPGIPAADREKVFRRFYRREASRTSPGNGLGLALVAAIATRHAAKITLEDAEPGLRVRIRLPREAVQA